MSDKVKYALRRTSLVSGTKGLGGTMVKSATFVPLMVIIMFVRLVNNSLVRAISSCLRLRSDGMMKAVTMAENRPSCGRICESDFTKRRSIQIRAARRARCAILRLSAPPHPLALNEEVHSMHCCSLPEPPVSVGATCLRRDIRVDEVNLNLDIHL